MVPDLKNMLFQLFQWGAGCRVQSQVPVVPDLGEHPVPVIPVPVVPVLVLVCHKNSRGRVCSIRNLGTLG